MCELFKLAIENRILLSIECGNLKRINEIVIYKKIKQRKIFCILSSYEIYDFRHSFKCKQDILIYNRNNSQFIYPTEKMELPKFISLLFTWTNASKLWFGLGLFWRRKLRITLTLKGLNTPLIFADHIWPKTRQVIPRSKVLALWVLASPTECLLHKVKCAKESWSRVINMSSLIFNILKILMKI